MPVSGLMLTAARSILDHHRVGRVCNPFDLAWARDVLAKHEAKQ